MTNTVLEETLDALHKSKQRVLELVAETRRLGNLVDAFKEGDEEVHKQIESWRDEAMKPLCDVCAVSLLTVQEQAKHEHWRETEAAAYQRVLNLLDWGMTQ